jgi:hypothetical protein
MLSFRRTCREARLTASRIRLTLPSGLYSGRQFQGLNTMCSQSPRALLDVIRRGGVPYPHGEIEHDVIAALMRTRVQIPHKRFLEKAFRWAQNANVHHLVSSF